jgi:hypothetical protein
VDNGVIAPKKSSVSRAGNLAWRAFGTRWRSRQTAQFRDERIVLATSGGQGVPSFAARALE